MNPVIETIKQRRSVRSYRDAPVARELIGAIIDAGNWAPTGNDVQHWRFVVAQDRAFRQRLVAATRPTFQKIVGNLRNSTDQFFRTYLQGLCTRCLGTDPGSYEGAIDHLLGLDDGAYWEAPVVIFVIGGPPQECSMVCQNMMLAAHALGLGSCIVGFGSFVMDDPEIVAALELQKEERIHGPVVIGYPAIVPEPPTKKPPVIKWI